MPVSLNWVSPENYELLILLSVEGVVLDSTFPLDN